MTSGYKFDPINKAHAIAEAVLFFEFSPSLADAMSALTGLKESLHEKLPAAEVTQLVEVALNQGTGIRILQGLRLSRYNPDGSLAWQLNVEAQAISFHCLDYSRWNEVWPELRRYSDTAFRAIGGAQVSVVSVGLKYIDRFIWRGPEDAYDATLLFDKASLRLHQQAFASGSRWHCHTGWFESKNGTEDVLNQLNVDSGRHLLNGMQAVIVNIDHAQILRSNVPGMLNAYGGSSSQALEELAQRLHRSNKDVLASLLTPRMSKLINLHTSPSDDPAQPKAIAAQPSGVGERRNDKSR